MKKSRRKSVKKSPKNKPSKSKPFDAATLFDADIQETNTKRLGNLLKIISLPEIKGLKNDSYVRMTNMQNKK